MRHLPIDEIRSKLLTCIMEHMTVQQLFDQIYGIIQLPMICFDPSFSLLAYSFQRPFYYPHWEWLADSGSASQETILEYDYFSNQEEMVQNHGSILFDSGTTDGFAQYCGAVMNGDQLVAYCGIMTEDAARIDVQITTDMLINALSVIMRHNNQGDNEIRSILITESLTKNQSDYLSRRCKGNYSFITATCISNHKSTLQFIKSNLIWKGFHLLSCLVGDEILYILAGDQNSYMERESLLNALQGYSDKHGILFGISDCFTDPADIPSHRQQSVLAISLAAVSGVTTPVSLFNDYYSSYICQCAAEFYGTDHCMFPHIKTLSEEDSLRGTENLRTLYAWFDVGMNNAKAALVLGVHQATMINRLKHIAVFTGLDPSENFDSLRLEMKMYEIFKSHSLRGKEVV